MADMWNLPWEARRIRERIAHQYDDEPDYEELVNKLNSIKSKMKPQFGEIAKKLVEKFADIVSVGICCGKHWQDLKISTDESFAYARKNTSVGYKANIVWTADDMTQEDYLQVNVWINHLKPHAAPTVELNKLCLLFNRLPTLHYGGEHTCLATMGIFDKIFCHFNLYCSEPKWIEKFDFTDTIELPSSSLFE